jgi:hypothetical protein
MWMERVFYLILFLFPSVLANSSFFCFFRPADAAAVEQGEISR